MSYCITIDGGTTNTRLYLFEGESVTDSVKLSVGASNGRDALASAVREGLRGLCGAHGISFEDLECIAASGMIGSELGLYEAPRVTVPATVGELRKNLVTVLIGDVCPVPITFIPGLLQNGGALTDGDLIRGEETEALGLIAQMKPQSDAAVLLPGTHNKLMLLAADGTIRSFCTAMSGDLVRAAAEHTVLAASLKDGFSKKADEKSVLAGYELVERLGLTAALFKLRVADKLGGTDPMTLYAMLIGMILHEDLALIGKVYDGKTLYVSGSEPFRSALYALCKAYTGYDVRLIGEETASLAVPIGARMIALKR